MKTITPHKHRDMIIAWANGHRVQSRVLRADRIGTWVDTDEDENPDWDINHEYRIRPDMTYRIRVNGYIIVEVDDAESEQHAEKLAEERHISGEYRTEWRDAVTFDSTDHEETLESFN